MNKQKQTNRKVIFVFIQTENPLTTKSTDILKRHLLPCHQITFILVVKIFVTSQKQMASHSMNILIRGFIL